MKNSLASWFSKIKETFFEENFRFQIGRFYCQRNNGKMTFVYSEEVYAGKDLVTFD